MVGRSMSDSTDEVGQLAATDYAERHGGRMDFIAGWDARSSYAPSNAKVGRLLTMVQPIIARTEGQIGTHSDRCYEYHVACLAVIVKDLLSPEEKS